MVKIHIIRTMEASVVGLLVCYIWSGLQHTEWKCYTIFSRRWLDEIVMQSESI